MAYVYKVRRRTPAPVAVEPVEAPAESPAAVIPATAAATVAAPKKRKATGPKKPRRKKSDG